MRRNDGAMPNERLPFRPQFCRPPMPQNYRLADPVGPFVPRMPSNQENPHYHKTGIITKIDNNKIYIDEMYSFEAPRGDHKVNDSIVYECYDGENGALVVVKIEQNYGRSRGHPQASEARRVEAQDQSQVILLEHTVTGQITEKRKNVFFIQEHNIIFNLQTVRADFVPKKGDWIEMTCSGRAPDRVGLLRDRFKHDVCSIKRLTSEQIRDRVSSSSSAGDRGTWNDRPIRESQAAPGHLNREWEAVPEQNQVREDVRIDIELPPRPPPLAAPNYFAPLLPDGAVQSSVPGVPGGPGQSHSKM